MRLEMACGEIQRMLAWLVYFFCHSENPCRARDAVTFFEPTPSERGSSSRRGVQAHPIGTGSLKRWRDPHLVVQVQTGPDTRHNGRGSLILQVQRSLLPA